MPPLTKLQFHCLAGLARCPMHPYFLRQEIIELSERRFWPSGSSVRKCLKDLEAKGLVIDCRGNPYYWLKAKRSVPYEITAKGIKQLTRELSTYQFIISLTRARLAGKNGVN